MTKECHANEKLFKIPVEIEEPNYLYFMHYLGNNLEQELFVSPESDPRTIARKRASKAEEKLRKYNAKLAGYIEKVKHRLHRVNFYECYAENPLKFIHNFILQQNGLLKMFKEDDSTAELQEAALGTMKEKVPTEEALKKYLAETEKKPEQGGGGLRIIKTEPKPQQ